MSIYECKMDLARETGLLSGTEDNEQLGEN